MPMPCHVFIRWHCHYLFVPALVSGTLPFLLSSGEFFLIFGYLGCLPFQCVKKRKTVCLSPCIFILNDVFYHLVNMM